MEIERKFLTEKVPFSLEQYHCAMISQYYISFSPTIRIRQSNNDYFLTVKGKGHLSHEEFELSITQQQYQSLQKKCDTPPIIKKRYFVPLQNNLTAEIDFYEGNLNGLITTEVEFPSEQAANAFIPPIWFGKDVTFDFRYKNTNLCIHGIPQSE
ncbi:CYTH domain-containing protein [Clostridium sp. MD294]|uniref:CYTH domain-containing protein n=1 Tax=Clostridium sp. MD294 TaxID=97138 RepID=UPI0002CA047D|nr:CYTH domain-containing protein [Clostridium sp. MD294]NDO47465.1 CYTH domain-containing protein [Clostridium sp. MD294]USF29464.1 Inorganic triphosphatase [Clostridium sp. MD294]